MRQIFAKWFFYERCIILPYSYNFNWLVLWVWILFRRGILNATICDKVCQWFVAGLWVSLGTPISSTNKTDPRNITEILFKHHKPHTYNFNWHLIFFRFFMHMTWYVIYIKFFLVFFKQVHKQQFVHHKSKWLSVKRLLPVHPV